MPSLRPLSSFSSWIQLSEAASDKSSELSAHRTPIRRSSGGIDPHSPLIDQRAACGSSRDSSQPLLAESSTTTSANLGRTCEKDYCLHTAGSVPSGTISIWCRSLRGPLYEGNPIDSAVTRRTLPTCSQGPVHFFLDFLFQAPLVDATGSCVYPQDYHFSRFSGDALLCCPFGQRRLRFVDLCEFGPVEWTLDGVQGFLMNTSNYVSSWDNWNCTFILLVLRAGSRKTCVERGGLLLTTCCAWSCAFCLWFCVGLVVSLPRS